MNVFGPVGVESYVKRLLRKDEARFRGRTWVDCPAGDGRSSQILHEIGATVIPIDLFPELFNVPALTCLKADVGDRLPVEDNQADYVLCQEGFEHFPDQYHVLREFSRVLRVGGRLILTTPNYSSLHARMSYLLFESVYAGRMMPPNEVDTVWYSRSHTNEIYFGHAFLCGIQRLRLLARVCGFRIAKLHGVRVNKTALVLFPFLYPAIVLTSFLSYFRRSKKVIHDKAVKMQIYREQLRLNLSPGILVDHTLFVEMEKTTELDQAATRLAEMNTDLSRVGLAE